MFNWKDAILAATLATGISGAAFGQEPRYREDGVYPVASSSYEEGYRDGARQAERDVRHGTAGRRNRDWNRRDRGDRRYREGYETGYERVMANAGGYNDSGYGNRPVYRDGQYGNGPYGNGPYGNGPQNNGPYNNGPYNNGPYNNGPYNNAPVYGGYGNGGNLQNQAYRIGYQAGVNDGRSDRSSGHSYRPTQMDNFKHADRGYHSSMGDKQQYKDIYRQGYQAGYQIGYEGR